MCLSTAASAGLELVQMRADSPAQVASALRWEHVSVSMALLALAGYVRLYLRAGRAWLLWTVCGLRTVCLFLNFLTGQNLNYLEISGLGHLSFLGESVSIARGVPSPWNVLGQLSPFWLVIYVIDAAIAVCRRGERRMAAVVGGSLVFFVLAGTGQAALIIWGYLQWPITPSVFFLGIVVAMGYESLYGRFLQGLPASPIRAQHHRIKNSCDLALRR
jgi:two-component system sensor kinase FixL